MVNTVAVVEEMKEALRQKGGITVRTNFDPLARIWRDRPQVPGTLWRYSRWNWLVRT